MSTQYAESQARFMRDTEHHKMEVLKDDGLYRHLRFKNPDDTFYWYDIVTWPGYLAIVGDAGDYVFSRIRDMFDFFTDHGYGISPDYWAEKLQAPRGTRAAQTYSEASLHQHVREWFEQQTGLDPRTGRVPAWRASEEMRRWRGFSRRWRRRQLFLLEGDLPACDTLRLSRQLESDVLSLAFSEHEAHEAARDFSFDLPGLRSLRIEDSWEWDLRDFEHQFLWCCWAVMVGIQRYKAQGSSPQPDPSTKKYTVDDTRTPSQVAGATNYYVIRQGRHPIIERRSNGMSFHMVYKTLHWAERGLARAQTELPAAHIHDTRWSS